MSRTETLPATTDSPATARKLIRTEMSQCDEQAIAAAELMISELVTNVVVHGRHAHPNRPAPRRGC